MTLIDKAEAHDDDLIRRGDVLDLFAKGGLHTINDRLAAIAAIHARGVGVKPDRDTFDAMCAMRNSINEHVPMPSLESDLLQGPENSVFCATVAEAVIKEVTRLRSMTNGARVKRLEWHNFDAWTHWAEGACGTYHVEERNGYWQVELRVGGLVHGVTQTDDTTPADLDAAKAAAQADYEARILAALAPTDAAPDLSDPVTVHANMLRGSIAKPTVEQIVHLYGREAFQPMIDVAIAKALEKACLAVSEHADWPEDEHGRTEQVGLFVRVINAIRAITPALSLAPTDAADELASVAAQLPGGAVMDGIKIKPLVWVDFPDRGAKAQAWNEANYMIQRWSDGRWELSASYPGYGDSIYGIDRFYSTLEAAKAAAQADYEARVYAALAAAVPADLAEAGKVQAYVVDELERHDARKTGWVKADDYHTLLALATAQAAGIERHEKVIAALAAAVPADLAEAAGYLLPTLQKGPEYVYRFVDTDNRAADLITALLARIAAQEAQMRESAMQELASLGQAQEAYEAQKAAETALAAERAKVAKLVEALTPSGETKAAYMGEFSIPFPTVDADGNEVMLRPNVPWTTIKETMAAIRARAAITEVGQ